MYHRQCLFAFAFVVAAFFMQSASYADEKEDLFPWKKNEIKHIKPWMKSQILNKSVIAESHNTEISGVHDSKKLKNFPAHMKATPQTYELEGLPSEEERSRAARESFARSRREINWAGDGHRTKSKAAVRGKVLAPKVEVLSRNNWIGLGLIGCLLGGVLWIIRRK